MGVEANSHTFSCCEIQQRLLHYALCAGLRASCGHGTLSECASHLNRGTYAAASVVLCRLVKSAEMTRARVASRCVRLDSSCTAVEMYCSSVWATSSYTRHHDDPHIPGRSCGGGGSRVNKDTARNMRGTTIYSSTTATHYT